jgi:hypothetical protein
MKNTFRFTRSALVRVALPLACMATWAQPIEAGLQAVTELAHINGQAMACQEMGIAAQAKALMLRHAPKTARFGNTFDEGTHLSFLAQTRSNATCPDEPTLRQQLLALALTLQANLPAGPPNQTATKAP